MDSVHANIFSHLQNRLQRIVRAETGSSQQHLRRNAEWLESRAILFGVDKEDSRVAFAYAAEWLHEFTTKSGPVKEGPSYPIVLSNDVARSLPPDMAPVGAVGFAPPTSVLRPRNTGTKKFSAGCDDDDDVCLQWKSI